VKKLRFSLFALLLALPLVLAACGGSSGDDESAVIERIEAAVASTNPADCERYATQAFLEQSQFEKGAAAVKGCEEDAADTEDDPDSTKVTNVQITGSKATADVAFEGGTFDGQTISIGLVEEDGDWKLDEIARFVKLDRERFVKAFEAGVTSGGERLPRALASCMGEVLRELPRPELEEVVIGGDPQPIVEIVEGCQQGSESSEA
jgi:hypothetical protein